MIPVIPFVITAIVSYLLGCCNTALLLSKYILHDDIRSHGSGNAGLTNFYRTFGKKMVLFVIIGDLLKAILSCLLGGWLIGSALGGSVEMVALGKLFGGIFAMLGHSFPFMFHFKGGKGVLCGAGVIMCMDWRITLVCLGVFALLVIATRWVSLGSMVAAVLFPINCWVIYHNLAVVLLAVVAGLLIVARHKDNAKRIVEGSEHKFELKKE